jgi:hypothetical protein
MSDKALTGGASTRDTSTPESGISGWLQLKGPGSQRGST